MPPCTPKNPSKGDNRYVARREPADGKPTTSFGEWLPSGTETSSSSSSSSSSEEAYKAIAPAQTQERPRTAIRHHPQTKRFDSQEIEVEGEKGERTW
jgi:hypothetical protein